MRVLLLSILSVAAVVACLCAYREFGLSKQYKSYEHVFLNFSSPVVVVRIANRNEGLTVSSQWPDAILWLDLVKTKDDQVLHLSEDHIRQRLVQSAFPGEKWRGPFIERYTLAELRPVFADTELVADLLKEFPKQKFILNLTQNSQNIDADLVSAIDKISGVDERVLVQSPVDVVLKSTKKLKPLWVYGTSQPELVKLLSLESIWLAPAASYDGDVFISPLQLHNRPAFNTEVLKEMRRRFKKILLGPLETSTEYTAARKENPDGFIFATPELALKVFER
jgi:hypothetical protein